MYKRVNFDSREKEKKWKELGIQIDTTVQIAEKTLYTTGYT